MSVIHSLHPEGGNPQINHETCIRCNQCASICPAEVLVLRDNCIHVNPAAPFGCIACGHCMMVCPNGSITVTGRDLKPEDIRPLPVLDRPTVAAGLANLMRSRRSVRRFTGEEPPLELLERIANLASTAPMGIPPWDVGCVVVRGRPKVRETVEDVVKGYEGFLKFLRPWMLRLMRPVMKRSKYEIFASFILPLARTYVENFHRGTDVVFYDAPAVLIFHHSPYADAADAAIACTYAMLAAESLGLGSTIIGGAPPILARNRRLCEKLGIPAGNTPSLALVLGYPAVKFQHTIERRFSSVNLVE